VAEDHLQVQTASLDTVQGDLEAAASRLMSAKETMDSAVASNTNMWTTSGSNAAQRWQQADRKIQQLILSLHAYAVAYGQQTGETSQQFAQAENKNVNLFA
jgi:hypothetical protein